MQSITITLGKKRAIIAQPEDASGALSPGSGAVWNADDQSIATIDLTGDTSGIGLNGFVLGKKVGQTNITATGGPANQPFSSTFSVTVVPGGPTQFAFSFGPEVDQ